MARLKRFTESMPDNDNGDLEAELAAINGDPATPSAPLVSKSQEPIDAEIVPEAPKKRPDESRSIGPRRPHGSLKPKEKIFTAVVYRDAKKLQKRLNLSDRESKFLAVYLKTGNIAAASREIGVHPVTGCRYMKRQHIAEFLEERRLRTAKAADLTSDKIQSLLNDAVDGEFVSETQLKAASIAAKILSPRGPSVVINAQQNNFSGTSPFAGLEPKAMLDEIKRNLLEMGVEGE